MILEEKTSAVSRQDDCYIFTRKSLINCDNNNNLMDFIKLETKENKLNGNVRVLPTSYLRE